MDQPDGDQLFRDWNPGCPLDVEDTATSPRNRTQTWSDSLQAESPPPTDPSLASPVARPLIDHIVSLSRDVRDLAEPMVAFTIHPGLSRDPISVDPDATLGVFQEANPRASGAGSATGGSVKFPQSGDGIAGFRLLSELGRGAFGRVFLAEESLLGNRLVALKITRTEGDEPRILARLQHTHIVPIHSVHDDPKTGLRVMCMPYVGGANLAQILEATAAAQGTAGDDRSLLKALDIVALPPPSEVPGGSGFCRRRSTTPPGQTGLARLTRRDSPDELCADPGSTPVQGGLPPVADSPTLDGDQLAELFDAGTTLGTRWPLLSQIPWWSRSIARVHRAWPRSDPAPSNDRDPVQPARRFLREANFVRAAAWIIARLAEGLEHAHAHGLLHRDLKPSNILIAADGTPMLLDFNLATDTTIKATEADRGKLGGTLPYMAPEHLDAFHPHGTTPPGAVDERADIYALGLILFEMIAGQRPFAEPDSRRPILDVIRTLIDERKAGPPSLRSHHPGVPRDLDALVSKCLHPDPDRRHARAGDLAEDLRRFLDDQPLKYTPEPTLGGRLAKWVRRNPRATGASTVGLVGLALIIGLSATAWSVGRHLTVVSARLRLKGFETRFPECQFLLNTVGGPVESLGRGITLAEETLEQAGISLDLDPQARTIAGGWLDVLPAAERGEIRKDLAEVILLVARARVYLADRTHSPTEQRRATERAIAWLDRAEAIDPSPTMTLYDDRANYLSRIGQAERAALDRRRHDAIAPSTGRDYYLLGTSLLAQRQPDRAEAALIKATTLSPQGYWPWFALGLCHFDQKRYADSAGDFAVCSVLSPRFAWPWMNRGLALAKDNRLIEARAAYDRAVAADGSMRDALANRGLVALELNDVPAAVADLEQAVSLGRRDVNTEAALGEALGRAGRTDEAIRLLDTLLAQHPEALLPRIARGTLRIATDPAGAEADFRQILQGSPQNPGAYLGLARLRRRTDPCESLHYATLALECDPHRVDTVELCAWLRGSLGDPAVVADVNRLVRTPTPNRLYNAACSLALYVKRHPDPVLAERAIGYLRRAIQSGKAVSMVRDDPDFLSLRAHPAFIELLASQPKGHRPSNP